MSKKIERPKDKYTHFVISKMNTSAISGTLTINISNYCKGV